MVGERAQKAVLVIIGVLFVATIYPLATLSDEPTLQMMLSLYVTLGIFLLLASRNPAAHRSLIAFAAWSSFAHAATMTVQAFFGSADRGHLIYGSLLFAVLGIGLLMVSPAKPLALSQKETVA